MKGINKLKKIDLVILITVTILICVGLFSVRQAYILKDDLEMIFLKQIAGIVIGYILLFVVMFIDIRIIYKLSLHRLQSRHHAN